MWVIWNAVDSTGEKRKVQFGTLVHWSAICDQEEGIHPPWQHASENVLKLKDFNYITFYQKLKVEG